MKNFNIKITATLIAVLLVPLTASAQPESPQLFEGLSNDSVLIGVLIGALAVLFLLFMGISALAYSIIKTYTPQEETELLEEQTPFWQWFWLKFNAAVPQSQEKDIVMGHSYDGIKELDNDLPPWWKYGFYASIVFAGIYLYNYHGGYNEHEVSVREYMAETQQAEIARQAYLARMESQIDESNVALLVAQEEVGAGKAVYMQHCKVCHGGEGEGGVGPNLTDPYWLHGGSVSDIFSTIKYGVQEKGMISWEKKLTPKQIQQVSSFIVSLENTNPPNPKEPQGEIYEREESEGKPEKADEKLSMR